ncbi:MAG: gliding motility-associated C-terminal domain-containing protein [Bacteroidetes bacterium]|nr:gliding motility-associated C-terminal domain-containing protein [Bacteroidota bacterium]
MSSHIRVCVLSVLLCLSCMLVHRTAQANHVSGADLFYEYSFGNTYRITLVIYGNCDPNPSSANAFATLPGASPRIKVYDSASLQTTVSLVWQGDSVDVTPVCSAQKFNTACQNPNSSLPGIRRFTYVGYYTLNHTSANWRFLFEGQMGNGGAQAGRYNGITNIVSAGSNIMALEARLNNKVGNNSSPQFTTIPTPFYCVNVAQQYNLGANDLNGDSLQFSLVPGMMASGGTITSVSYNTGFSATNPLAVSSGSFSFNSATGQMNFTPNNTQVSLVVQSVNEYRNGVLVGTAMREMNFVVLSNCNNTPASSMIDTAKNNSGFGGLADGARDFNICYGTDSALFKIVALNAAKDTITVSVAGLPAGISINVDSTNKTQPVISIHWTSTGAPPGNHTFYVTYKDNGCPLTSTQTMAYTIHVIRPNQLSAYLIAPTQCVHQAWVDFSITNGLTPRSIYLRQSGNLIKSYRDSTGHLQDSLPPGLYDVEIRSDRLDCPTLVTLIVPDSGTYPNRPRVVSPIFYCLKDVALSLVAQADSGAVTRWFTSGGGYIGQAPTPRTDSVGIFFWTVEQQYKTCRSLRDTVQVYVTKRPIAQFSGPESICLYDTANFHFTGTVGVGPILDYRWNFLGAGYVTGDSVGPWHVRWFDTGYKVIILQVDENKCASFPYRDTIYVKQVPYAGFDVSDACQFDTALIRYNTIPPAGLQYAWAFDEALAPDSSGPGPYALRWTTPGEKHLSLTVNLNGCTDTRQRSLNIYPKPEAGIDYDPAKLCMGDLISMTGSGGGSYLWTSSDPNVKSSDQPVFTALVLRPQSIHLIVSNEWNCRDTASEVLSTVERCCRFSYPNAFTPNGDQHNDVFRVVTYGNQIQFEISIYNRWGERVFHGDNAQTGWDGRFNGYDCEAGTYFYLVRAECYTGQKEEHKGELLLIR